MLYNEIIGLARKENGARVSSAVTELLDDSDGMYMYMYSILFRLHSVHFLYMYVHDVLKTFSLFIFCIDKGNMVIALCLLPYLLPDSRSKPNPNKLLLFSHVS